MGLKAWTNQPGTFFGDEFLVPNLRWDKGKPKPKTGTGYNRYNQAVVRFVSKEPVRKLAHGFTFRHAGTYERYVERIRPAVVMTEFRTRYEQSGFGGSSDYFRTRWNCGGNRGTRSVFDDTNTRNAAITQALMQLADNKAQLGMALVEAVSSYRMLAMRAISFLEAYRRARRGDVWAAVKAVGLAPTGKKGQKPSPWLEWQFGWKPLMSDLYGAYHVARRVSQQDFILTGEGYAKSTVSGRVPVSDFLNQTWSVDRRYRVGILCQVEADRLRAANQLGLINPLSLYWDALPLSFLIDWFMPIGNVLEAASARYGLNFLTGYVSLVGRTHEEGSGTNTPNTVTVLENATWDCFYFKRNKLTDFPIPLPYARNKPFSSGKVLTALELFRLARL